VDGIYLFFFFLGSTNPSNTSLGRTFLSSLTPLGRLYWSVSVAERGSDAFSDTDFTTFAFILRFTILYTVADLISQTEYMSLVILSNAQGEYTTSDNVLGIQNPNSFHNAMSNTITLPPHSEVGVVSAKIHRSPEVVIQDDSVFMCYFGEMLDQSVAERLKFTSTNIPIPVKMPRGTYTREQVETVLQKVLSDAFGTHPNLAWSGVVVTKPASGGLPTAVPGGWSYRLTQTSVATEDPVPRTPVVNDISGQELTFQFLGDSIQNNVVSLAYDKATKRIKRTIDGSTPIIPWDTAGIAQIKNLPITMTSALDKTKGAMSVVITEAITNGGAAGLDVNEGWEIGLTRPSVRSSQAAAGSPSNPDWYLGGIDEYCDYKVKYDGRTGKLELWQSRVLGGAGIMDMREVEYYGPAIVAVDATAWAAKVDKTDLVAPYGAANLNRLNWTIEGEGMKVWLSDDTFINPRVLMDTTNNAWSILGLHRAFKPTGTTTQALYPQFNLSTKTRFFTLTHYEVPLPWSRRHGETDGYNFPDNVPLGGAYPPPSGGSSFWGKSIYDDLFFNQASLERTQTRIRGIGAQPSYACMDGSTIHPGGGALIASEAIKYGYGLILANAGDGSGEYSNQGSTENCRSWLGFPSDVMPGNVLSYDGYDHQGTLSDAGGLDPNGLSNCKWVVNSGSGLDYTPKQLFVKCPSLTHQSFNFCKGLTSKILWSLPRFSNSGETTGPLFFQQSSPIYLELKNNAPLVINDLQIDFVDKDEHISKDLSGETVVILHFRTKHKCG